MRPDIPEDTLKEAPQGTEEVLKEEENGERKHDSFFLKKITIKGNTIYSAEDLRFLYQDQLHNLTTLKTLKKLAKSISNFYRKNGYILCRATLPDQDVLDGDVEFVVHEQGIKHIGFVGDLDEVDHLKEVVQENLRKSFPFRLKDLQTQMNLLRSSAQVLVFPAMYPLVAKNLHGGRPSIDFL